VSELTTPRIVQSEVAGLGHLYAPAGAGPCPAIMLLHGSEGALGWLGHREAALFAAHGFLALPFAYSVGGSFWIGGDIWETDLDRTEAALAALRAHPQCRGQVGVYGWSRGAEHALLVTALMSLAALPHLPDAVAAHAPPDVVQGAWRNLFSRAREPDGSVEPLPVWRFRSDRLRPGVPAWRWRGRAIEPGAPITIEAYAGPVFLSVGDQDEIWPADMTARLAERLRAAGRAPEVHIYEGQAHMPDPATWNVHLQRLLSFFGRTLG
jgi:dipeptidyl aminopeptidase/acylaminoacyl peptidase